MRVPRRIPIDKLRATLGDVEYERLVMAMYGPEMAKPEIHLKPDQIELALSLVAGQGSRNERRRMSAAVAVYRKYLGQPTRKGKFVTWAKRELYDLNGQRESESESDEHSEHTDVGTLLKQASQRLGISLRQIALEAGVHPTAVYSATKQRHDRMHPHNAEKVHAWLAKVSV